jgi:hypothetical protein
MTSTPEAFLDQYVGEVLNNHDLEAIDRLFDSTFVDHDPLTIPGVISPQAGMPASIDFVKRLVDILSESPVDIHFTLEDVISVDNKVAYRLFGEGTVDLVDSLNPISNSERTPVKKLAIANTHLAFSDTGSDTRMILRDKINVTYSCVGILQCRAGAFVDRWGIEYVS